MIKKLMTTALAKFLFAGLLSFAAFPALAQLSLGARAGINVVAEPYINYTHLFLARPYVGILANYRLQNPWAFQVEMSVSGEGSKVKDVNGSDTYKNLQTYLNIPFLVQYHFLLGTYLEAGPQFSFLLAARENFNGSSADAKSYYKTTAAGFVFLGVGHQFRRARLNGFGVNIRYMRDATTITKTSTGGSAPFGGDELKNRVLSIGLTYKWAVTK